MSTGDRYEGYPFPAPWYEPEAPHLGHEKHLCNLAKKGTDFETYKALVKDPKFICKKCGRAAAKEENLCEPAPL